MDRRPVWAVGVTLADVMGRGRWMEQQVDRRQWARRRTPGPQRMTHRPQVATGGRREGLDELEVEERGVDGDGQQQRRRRAEEEDEHERARP